MQWRIEKGEMPRAMLRVANLQPAAAQKDIFFRFLPFSRQGRYNENTVQIF
jgi:hypothetical protein